MMAPGVILHAELISVVYFHKSLLLSPRAVHYRFSVPGVHTYQHKICPFQRTHLSS